MYEVPPVAVSVVELPEQIVAEAGEIVPVGVVAVVTVVGVVEFVEIVVVDVDMDADVDVDTDVDTIFSRRCCFIVPARCVA